MLEILTVEPPIAAGPFRVMVPVVEFPPDTELGFIASD